MPLGFALATALIAFANGDPAGDSESGTQRRMYGHLVIVGGGPPVAEIYERTLQIAGGAGAQILIVPHASPDPRAGEKSADLWRSYGATDIRILDLANADAAHQSIEQADLIWFRGGEQERLMSALQDAGVVEAIRARHAQGKTIGGTSAGAAVMSQTMITRSAGRRGTPEANVPVTGQGLGLWPAVIVDQHFLKRKRQERLKSAVLTHPTLVGIGIEESTAIFVNGGEFEVVGAGPVTIYDARATTSPAPEAQTSGPGDLASPTQTLVSRTLTAGARFRLDGGTVVDPQPEPGATSGAAQAP